MPLGQGKYDDLCTMVREKSKADAAIVAIIGGDRGTGFSMQVVSSPEGFLALATLPDVLESMAKQIREAGGTA